jgi:hypothetical protein
MRRAHHTNYHPDGTAVLLAGKQCSGGAPVRL